MLVKMNAQKKRDRMTQMSSECCSIAWFKLAELVSRREKERAFSILRLLSHSLSDPAYVVLLEADLLQAFQDSRAYESYLKAAALYMQTGRYAMVGYIYETVIYLHNDRDFPISRLIEFAQEIEDQSFLQNFGMRILSFWTKSGKSDYALHCALALQSSAHVKAAWLDMILSYAHKHTNEPEYRELIDKYAQTKGEHWSHDISVLMKTLQNLSL